MKYFMMILLFLSLTKSSLYASDVNFINEQTRAELEEVRGIMHANIEKALRDNPPRQEDLYDPILVINPKETNFKERLRRFFCCARAQY